MPTSYPEVLGFRSYARANASASLDEQRALVAGGTQGIGAGIALRYALAGAEVWLVGRSRERGDAVVEKLQLASAEYARRNDKGKAPQQQKEHAFFSADLGDAKEISRVIGEIKAKAGEKGIDWLVQTQGGPPTGTFRENPAGGYEQRFAVQCLSRFGIAAQLAEAGVVKQGIILVAAPGSGGKKEVDVEDLDFAKARETGEWKSGLFGLLSQGARQSAVLDSVSQTLAERHPSLRIAHIFPGVCKTNALANAGGPQVIQWLTDTFGGLVMNKAGVGGFAEVPFYLAATAEGRQLLRTGEANLFSPGLRRYELSPSVRELSVRQRIWERLSAALR